MNEISIVRDVRRLGGQTETAEFWSIVIDGSRITDKAHPFNSAESEIILSECDYCYHCSLPEISARRLGNSQVVWFVSLDREQTPTVDRGSVFVFDSTKYQSSFGGVLSDLPAFTDSDLRRIVSQLSLHDWHVALYTLPDLPSDPMGRNTLRVINEALNSNDLAFKCDVCPDNMRPLHIGLDVEGVPELVVDFIDLNGKTCFRLNQNPTFPIWLTVEGQPDLFAEYHTDSEIAR